MSGLFIKMRMFLLILTLTIFRQSYGDQGQCGKVVHKIVPIPLAVFASKTLEGQWPWHVAIYKAQALDNRYICGGTLISNRYVITAAYCVTDRSSNSPVDENKLSVHLGKHNLLYSFEGTQHRFVDEIIIYPEYNHMTFDRNLAIIKLREPVVYTDWVQPVCLWPEKQIDQNYVIGKKGSVVGWGIDENNQPSEELKLVEMPVVDQKTCISSYVEFYARFTSDYTYCAGNRNGTSLCNGDSGGGMVFNSDGVWYLRGIVSLTIAKMDDFRCDPNQYLIFTDLAKFLPWIKKIITAP